MNPGWIYTHDAQAPSMSIDFAEQVRQGFDVPGEEKTLSLAGLSLETVGDWTFYMERRTSQVGAFSPTRISYVDLQTGRQHVRGRLLISPPVGGNTNGVLGRFMRGICVHVTAGILDGSLRYIPQALPTPDFQDSLIAWVSPGRPARYWIPGVSFVAFSVLAGMAAKETIPVYGRSIRFALDALVDSPFIGQPSLVFYRLDTVTAQYSVVAALATAEQYEFTVPAEATHFAFVDVATAVSYRIDYSFECFS